MFSLWGTTAMDSGSRHPHAQLVAAYHQPAHLTPC
jgi:hypothetical protein